MPENFSTPYAGYDVLAKWDSPSWNEQTREVVRQRLRDVPPRRFLEPEAWETLEAVCARLLPQPDRRSGPVPIVPFIDALLHRGQGDGYRYEDMPDLRTSWRLGVSGIDGEARRRHGAGFRDLDAARQDSVLRAVQEGEVEGAPWDELPPRRFFSSVLLKSVVGIYYAHPAAWSEIGFGGPASPRGYVRLGFGKRDPWEAREAAPAPQADDD